MSDTLRDDQFEAELRRFVAWQAADTAGAATPQQMAARIAGHTPATGLFGLSPQLLWIVLAGLLMAAIAGAAVAAALLLRTSQAVLPAPTAVPSPTAAVGTLTAANDPLGNYCGASATNDLSLEFVIRTFDPAFEETLLLVSADGTVLSGKRSDLTFGTGMRQRRLTETGLVRLTDLVFRAGLPNCQPVVFGSGKEDGWLVGRRGVEQTTTWFGSNSSLQIRRNLAAETAATARLTDQLNNLDDILDPSNWRDAAWKPYLPDEWKLMVELMTETEGQCGLDMPPTAAPVPTACMPWANDLKLPTGTPLLAFGTLYPAISQTGGGWIGGYRCGLVDRPQADAIPDAFGLKPGFDGPYTHQWTNGDGSDQMNASLTAQLPIDAGCERPDRYALGQPAPTPSGPPPTDLAPPVDACAVITGAIAGAGTAHSHMEAWTPGGDGRWTACYAEVSPGDIEVFVRDRATAAADSASYVASLFGDGITPEQLADRTVYWNDCFNPDGACTPAAAVASGPHLIVITWLGQNRQDFESMITKAVQAGVLP
jgi:hypothetical protein